VQTTEGAETARTAADWSPVSFYALAVVPSLLVCAWGAWAQFVPNPDAALYLRSAELFTDGHWRQAVSIYGWPTYSLVIAGVMRLTGVDAFTAAQIVNVVCSVVTPFTFVALVRQLSNDRLVTLCAAIVIGLQPELTQMRSSVIRDNCYFAFLLLTLYLVARDLAQPRLATKLATGAAIVAAGLFRIEGFVLAALVLIYHIMCGMRTSGRRWAAPALAVTAGAMIVPGIWLWFSSGNLGHWLTGRMELGAGLAQWLSFVDTLANRVARLKNEFLYPFGGGNAWGAYVGMTLGIATVNIVRAVTIPLAILTTLAFVPRRLMPRPVNAFVLWFAFGQLPVLVMFTFVAMLLDRRYAVGLALVLDVALAYLLAELVRLWPRDKAARWLLPVLVTALLAVWALNIPRPTRLGYLKEAGQWIAHDVPARSAILTNDNIVAYFSGRTYGTAIRLWTPSASPAADDAAELSRYDYFVLHVDGTIGVPAQIRTLSDQHPVRTFAGAHGGAVVVYKRKQADERAP
jgi:hypothetical protein